MPHTCPSSPPAGSEHHPSVPYHYFRRAGWTQWAQPHLAEMASRSAHRLITEKAGGSLAGPRRGPSSLPTYPGVTRPHRDSATRPLLQPHSAKTLNLWILPSAMCRVDLSSLPAIPLGMLGSHLGFLDLGREEEASGDLWQPPPHACSPGNLSLRFQVLPTPLSLSRVCPGGWLPPVTNTMNFNRHQALSFLSALPLSTCLWCHTSQAGCPQRGSLELGVQVGVLGAFELDCQGHL